MSDFKAERRRIIAIEGNEITLGEPEPMPDTVRSPGIRRGDWINPLDDDRHTSHEAASCRVEQAGEKTDG